MPGPLDPNLLRRARATRGYLVAGAAVGCLTAVLTIGQARLLSDSVTDVFDGGSVLDLWPALVALAAIFCGRGVLTWANQWLGNRTAAAVKSQLRTDIVRARLRRPVGADGSTGGLVTLVTQGLDALDGYFSKYLPQLLLAATVPIIVVVSVFFSDVLSGFILLVTIPLIPVFMTLIGRTTQARQARRWAIQSRLARHFADLITGLPTLQVFGRARAQLKGLRLTEKSHRSETLGTLRISFLSAFVLELAATLSVAVIAVTIGFRVVYGHLDLATALFVLIIAPEAYLPVRQVGVHFHDSAEGAAAAKSAFALIDEGEAAPAPPTAQPPTARSEAADKPNLAVAQPDLAVTQSDAVAQPDHVILREDAESMSATRDAASSRSMTVAAASSTPLLELRGLTHTYPDADASALAGFDLALHPGDVVALTGPSGGGKTTILNAIMGFITPTAGDVLVDGRPIADLAAWRQQVAYVGQFPGLIAGTVADNVRIGHPKATDDAVRAALDEAGAPQLALDHPVAMDAEGVSAGERRRIATARALLRVTLGRARLMILDEPTAGLDADSEAVLLSTLKRLKVAALVVTHRPAVMAQADRLVRLAASVQSPAPAASVQSLASAPSVQSPSDGVGVENSSTAVALDASPSGQRGVTAQLSPSVGVENSSVAPVLDARAGVRRAGVAEGATPPTRGRLISRVFDSVPGSRVRLAVAMLLAVCATGASVALMGASAWLLSFAATLPPVMYLEAPAVAVRFFGISRGVFRYLERLTSHDIALRLQSALRLETYAALSRTTLLGARRGDLLTRVVADVEAIQNLVVRVWIPFVSSVVVIAATCGVLAAFSPGSAFVLLVSAVFAGLLVPWLASRASRRADTDAVPARGELADAVHELSRNCADLVAYGQDAAFVERFEAVDTTLRRDQARSTWVRGVAEGFQVLAAGAAVLGALWIGGAQVNAGTLPPVVLAVLAIVPLALHESLASLAQAAQTHTRAREALRRVEDVTSAEPVGRGDVPDHLTQAEPSLRVRDLAAGWPDGPVVIRDLDLEIAAGERVALTGSSGIGKTTVAATILGLIDARGGEVVVTGRPGYLAQDAHIFNTSVIENVRIGNRDATDDDIVAALRRAGLGHLDPRRIVGEEGSTLSGGEIRRVSLARLFVGRYQVLILDEPTEHLDALTAAALMDDIWACADGLPILAITHDPEVVARCDREVPLGAFASAV